MRGRHQRPQCLLAAVLLLAFLPSLSFAGHWDELAGQPRGETSAASLSDGSDAATERVEHALHCHSALASCSAEPLPAGLGFLATHESLLPALSLRPAATVRRGDRAPAGRTVLPLSPPPRAA